VAYVPRNNAMMPILDPWPTVQKHPLPKTVNLENTPINIICCMGMVTLLQFSIFQAICSFVAIPCSP
jgi:hypothetical protein